MISLSIASIERIPQEQLKEMFSSWNLEDIENINSYNNPVFIDRRLGYCIIKYFEEYYKLPYYLVSESKQQGDKILTICGECFSKTMYDSHSNSYYCPRCES